MKKIEVPTSNLPIYIKEHIDAEKHPYCNITIINGFNNDTEITITPSKRKFYI